MSDVYLALVSSAAGVNKLLVVKQLRASLIDEPEALSMFMDEARLAARLHHPNVVQTFEVGREGPLPFMTMEFLDGQPLHRVLRRLGSRGEPETAHEVEPLTLGMVLRITTEMLEGLHYAHELRDYDGSAMNVVHRDVSPQNLFISYDGQIKLVDFGIAKASASITRTEGRGLKGKLAYMSPQHAGGEALDRRADVFAAGVMLWEMLSGRRLWAGCNEATIARRLVDHELPELALDDVPAALLDICRKALAPALEQRFATVERFRQALEQFMDRQGLDASPRAIGKRVARAFAAERTEVRARIDQELLRQVEGGSLRDAPASLWSDAYRGEHTDRTLESNDERLAAAPDEVTADYGPSEPGESATLAALVREPPREASGVIGAPTELPDAPSPSPRDRRARGLPTAPTLGVIAVLSLALALVWSQRERPQQSQQSSEAANPEPSAARDAPPPTEPTIIADCDLPPAQKPRVPLSGEIEADATLRCDRNYVLTFDTRVAAGATLTIEAGTTIYGDRETKGSLVIEPGARLIAEGTPERPIVFTSARPPAERQPGDWGGVLLLGRAPINLRDARGRPMRGSVEGLSAATHYGGDAPEDDSGVLRYVRIEYPGVELAPANEINGLTLAGVGRGTTIDHVMVRASSDDCFEFFGGTVDASHLVCDSPGDDALDFDHGYHGRLQFVVVRDRVLAGPTAERSSNALEIDNDPNGTTTEPRTQPVIWNATLCGVAGGHTPSYGILARRAAQPELGALLISGFDYALDRRDAPTQLQLHGLALVEQAGAEPDEPDDDGDFDELAWLAEDARALMTEVAGFGGCGGPPATSLLPTAAIVPASPLSGPPDDGFFEPDARFIGAFSGPGDDWMSPWVVWTE